MNMNVYGAAMVLPSGESSMTRERADRYVEVFLVSSWAEHQRQHERQTQADHDLEERLASHVASPPQVRHLIFAQAKE